MMVGWFASSVLNPAGAVEIDGQRRRLDLVEGRPRHAVGYLAGLLLDGDGASTHGRPRTPDVLALDRHLESVELIDERQDPRILAVHVRERGAHGTEGLVHLDGLFRHELAVLPGHL